MKIIRESLWDIKVTSNKFNSQFTSAKKCKLSDQLKVIGVIIESDMSIYLDDDKYTIIIKEIRKHG